MTVRLKKEPRAILIKNYCTISYYLFLLWLTCQIDKEFLKEIELVGGVNEIISKIIKLKDSSSWHKQSIVD
jgi:hypothetical protein